MRSKLFILLICAYSVISQRENNVCSSFEAYVNNMSTNPKCWYDPDVYGTPHERAQNNGYLLDEHVIRTDDGYLLTTFRLKTWIGQYGKEVVFLQHGLSADANSFLINKNNSIPYFLLNKGFDVWLGNSRGTQFSSHETLLDTDPKYWDFSHHEIALYDLPAVFKYVTKKTGRKITYVGHSRGGTTFAIYASMQPEEAEKYIKHAILVAPAFYIRHSKGVYSMEIVNNMIYPLVQFLQQINYDVLMKPNSFEKTAAKRFCFSSLDHLRLCFNLIFAVSGDSLYPFDPEMFPIVLDILTNTNTKSAIHYMQGIKTGTFRMFDYGPEENMIRYNSEYPPDYNLSDITVSMTWIYGSNDWINPKEDILYAFEKCSKSNLEVLELRHSHFDFLFVKEAKNTILPMLLKVINKNLKS